MDLKLRSDSGIPWYLTALIPVSSIDISDLPSMSQQRLLLYFSLHLFPDSQFCQVSATSDATVGILRAVPSKGRCV